MLNRDLTTKTRQGILSCDLIDRECQGSFPSKVNGKYAYEGKPGRKYLTYKVERSLCDTIYKGITQPKFKKIMDGHFSDVQRILKNGKNQTYFLPILDDNLNLLCHAQTYLSAWNLR